MSAAAITSATRLLLRYLDLSVNLTHAESELSIAEKRALNAPLPPPIGTQYFHDVSVSLVNPHITAKGAKGTVEGIKKEKVEVLGALKKALGLSGTDQTSKGDGSDSGGVGSAVVAVAKMPFASFVEVMDAITHELSEVHDSNPHSPSGLRLFVHDRLGHSEPALHFASWEQRVQQRFVQAKDKVGKAKQGLVNVCNSTAINFKQHALVQDLERWTLFVAVLDEAFAQLLVLNLRAALEAYTRQLQGKHVRELFAVNVKLNPQCVAVTIPSTPDLAAKLSALLRQTLFTVCPENAVAHVISTPTAKTKDPDVSPKKLCLEDQSLMAQLTALDGVVAREICDSINATVATINKEWSYYWSPAMVIAKGIDLVKAITAIQSSFDVSYPIHHNAVVLNAFPLQDAVISMIHVHIEKAKDNEIKSLVEVWAKAQQQKEGGRATSVSSSGPARPLAQIGVSSAPATHALGPKSLTLDPSFNPLAFALRVVAQAKVPYASSEPAASNAYVSTKTAAAPSPAEFEPVAPAAAATPSAPPTPNGAAAAAASTASSNNAFRACAVLGSSGAIAPSSPNLAQQPRQPSVPRKSADGNAVAGAGSVLPAPPSAGRHLNHPLPSATAPPQPLTPRTAAAAAYTTMTVEVVKDGRVPLPYKDEGPIIADTPVKSNNAPDAGSGTNANSTTSPAAAEFRRRMEEANSALQDAAQRKEEMARRSPRTSAAAVTPPPPPPAEGKEQPRPSANVPAVVNAWETPVRVNSSRDIKLAGEKNAASAAATAPSLSSSAPPTVQRPTQPPATAAPTTSVPAVRPIIKRSSSFADQSTASSAHNAATTTTTAAVGASGSNTARTVDFDPVTTTGGNGPSAAFKKASAPPEDDDETILRKLMQKEKESMERIRLMKERDEQRRREIALAHRRTVAEEENPAVSGKTLPPLSAVAVAASAEKLSASSATSPSHTAGGESDADEVKLSNDKRIQDAVAKENEAIRQRRASANPGSRAALPAEASGLGNSSATRGPYSVPSPDRPTAQPTTSSTVVGHASAVRNPVYAAGGGGRQEPREPSYSNQATPVKHRYSAYALDQPSTSSAASAVPTAAATGTSDPLRVEGLVRSSTASATNATTGRPDSALRRKLALPPVSGPSSPSKPFQPTPPPLAAADGSAAGHAGISGAGFQALRKPQTAPVGTLLGGGGGNTPRGSAGNSYASNSLDVKTMSLLDLYKAYCAQSGIKTNSGLLKMLPKTVGENVTRINLDLNYIGVKGFQPLLQILKVNRGLTFLNLKDNNLENNEVRALVAVLCTEAGDMLQHLDLSNNPISLAGGTALMDLIAKQRALKTVVVNGTLIQPKIVEKINETLANKQ